MKKVTAIYWKEDDFWLGKFEELPEIMTQGTTIEELMEKLQEAYKLMVFEDVPDSYQQKELVV